MIELYKKNYDVIAMNSRFTFRKNEEKKFANFVKDFVKEFYNENERSYDKTKHLSGLLTIFLNSIENIDLKELWKNLDKRLYCDYTEKIYEKVLSKVDFDDFRFEINKIKDYKLAYNYYILYGKVKKISLEKMIDKYLENYLNVHNSGYGWNTNDAFCYFFNYAFDISPYYNASHINVANDNSKEIVNMSNCFFDEKEFDIEIDYTRSKNPRVNDPTTLSSASTPMLYLLHKLLPEVYLNKTMHYDYQTDKLREIIPCVLKNQCKFNDNEGLHLLIKDFLFLDDFKTFKTYKIRSYETNTFELCVILGDMKLINQVINSDNFEFVSPMYYYDALKNEGYVQEGIDDNNSKDDEYLEDYLDLDTMICHNLSHRNLLSVLLHDKVKLLNISFLYSIKKEELLDEEEFTILINHIKEKGIIVYKMVFTSYIQLYRVDDIQKGLEDKENEMKKTWQYTKRYDSMTI